MPLCEICTTAIQTLRPQAGGELLRGERNELPSDVKDILPRLQQATDQTCWLCSKFAQWLEAEYLTIFEDWVVRPLPVEYSTVTRASASLPEFILPFIICITPKSDKGFTPLFFAEANFIPVQDYIEPVSSSSRQHEAIGVDFNIIDSWVKRCSKDHRKCSDNFNSWYPTRLLHLDNHTHKVKLILTKDQVPDSQYATVSHRWGFTSYTQLESSTMTQLQDEVNVAGLPKVFQDAIDIARYLNIHYLWIDALCIQQGLNDIEDWKREAPTMCKVYSNAFINLSATLSSDGTESLLHKRCWGPILPSKIDLDLSGKIHEYYVIDGDLWYDEVDNAPLSNRGWVFQERFLARKVLHFGQCQLGWECCELDALETFPEGMPQRMGLYTTKPFVRDILAQQKEKTDTTIGKTFLDVWHNLVSEYSTCKLTKPTDKVVAFDGIAECMTNHVGGQHMAGMLENTLVYDLAWWRSSLDQEDFPLSETHSRAPSWSWTSVDGVICFPDTLGGMPLTFSQVWTFSKSTSNADRIIADSIIRTESVCIPLSIYQSRGKIASLRVAGMDFSVVEDGKHEEFNSFISLEGSSDDTLVLAQRGKILLLPLFITSKALHGIVLAKIRGVGAHRRLGAVRLLLHKEDVPKVAISTDMLEDNKQSAENSRARRDPWILDRRPGQPSNMFWNQDTLKLIEYIRNQRRPRLIEIC